MQHLPAVPNPRPYTRSPLLIIAYGAICSALLNLIFATGFIWIAGSAALAILLGLVEIVIQVRRRRASA